MSASDPGRFLRPEISFTKCGLTLPGNLNEDEYAAIGRQICQMRKQLQWNTGDWWAFGEDHEYGSRTKLVEGEEWADGPLLQTCKNAAVVCRAFTSSRRRDVLSFSHHSEVAGLPAQQADELLDWCEETIAETGKPRSTRELRVEVQRGSKPELVPTPATGAMAVTFTDGGLKKISLQTWVTPSEPKTVLLRPQLSSGSDFNTSWPGRRPVPPIADPAILDLEAAFDLIAEALRAAQVIVASHGALHRVIAKAQAALPVLRAALHRAKDHGGAASL